MHFEILVEDRSGQILIDRLMEKLKARVSSAITYRTIPYRGIGKLPENLDRETDPSKRVLLNKLPQLLRGYGKVLTDEMALIIVLDCDKRSCVEFKRELVDVYQNHCLIRPKVAFCIAIEELEAWLLGDKEALFMAYPDARRQVLESYVQDSQCDTWELLADAIYPKRSQELIKKGYPEIGIMKCEWFERISEHIDIDRNISPSFHYFIRKVKGFVLSA